MKKLFNQIKWAFQRMFRGWDDNSASDIASWFAKTLPEMLDYMIDNMWTYPDNGEIVNGEISPEEESRQMEDWANMLRTMAEGFREFSFENSVREEIDDNYKMGKFHRAMKLFAENYKNLWA